MADTSGSPLRTASPYRLRYSSCAQVGRGGARQGLGWEQGLLHQGSKLSEALACKCTENMQRDGHLLSLALQPSKQHLVNTA